jgi:alpha-glucosidase
MTSKIFLPSILFVLSLSLNMENCLAQMHELTSPDGKLRVQVNTDKNLKWKAFLNEVEIIESVEMEMMFDEKRSIGSIPKLKSTEVKQKEERIEPVIPNKDRVINSLYKEMTLVMHGKYSVVLRVYNDGIAYRFIDNFKRTERVVSEKMRVDLPDNTMSYFPKEESMYSHNERIYLKQQAEDFKAGDFCSLPVLFDTGAGKVLITEASLHDYPGMFLKYDKDMDFEAVFPKFVLEAVPDVNNSPDRNQILSKEAEYIAEVSGPRAYPWRVFMISDDDRTFIESNLVTQLSGQNKIVDTSWIRPGMVAWDWYNANNVYGVDFEAGLNTETYKYYVDFASDNDIEYVILDEGWTKSTTEILDSNPEINLPELIEYSKQKNVGIILWVLWMPLNENLEEILKLYSSWGAAGIKVDFMQRNDQSMVRSYEEIAETAAKYKLLVDFHGAFKPAGMERVWPNIVNYEGVKGNENNKWSADINPEHNLTLPFTRMAAGPMDFTPGAMVNKHSKNFSASFFRPMSLGTRCHQLAMYVVYEAPLQMLCESPSRYMQEQETVDFITSIPTTWDETRVIQAAVSDYVVIARRKGENWFLAAMTDDTPREFKILLDFLSEGSYQMESFRDGVNAKNYAEDYKRELKEVKKNDSLHMTLTGGGGWIAQIRKENN